MPSPGAQPGKRGGASHQPGNAARLVGGQGVHGVNHQRLDSCLTGRPRSGAVVEHRVQKALRLAAARAGGHQSAQALAVARQALPGVFLMAETGVRGLEGVKERLAAFSSYKGQAHLYIRAFEPCCLVIDKAAHQPVVESVCGLERGNQELFQRCMDVVGKQGWEHGMRFYQGCRRVKPNARHPGARWPSPD